MTRVDTLRCRAAEDRFVPSLVGTLSLAERFDLEAHLTRCADCDDKLRALAAAGVAYEGAFAHLRMHRTSMAPGRARLAAGAQAGDLAAGGHRWGGLKRLSELSLALSVMAFVIIGSLESRTLEATQPTTAAPTRAIALEPPSDEEMLRRSRLKSRAAIKDAGVGQVVSPAGAVRH